MKSISIFTNNLACDTLALYFSRLEKYFKLNEWVVKSNFESNWAIIAACGVTNDKFDNIKGLLDDLKKEGVPDKHILIVGCLPKTHEDDLRSVFSGNVISLGKEHIIDEMLSMKIPFSDVEGTNVFRAPSQVDVNSEKGLYNIKIAEGCYQECTFCVTQKAHGKLRSESIESIEKDFRNAISNGYKNINLIGTDTFAYGSDCNTNVILLMKYLLEIDESVIFYLGNLHAKWLIEYSDELLELCKQGHVKCLHMPIQHVNDHILKAMGRPILFEKIYEKIQKFKRECSDIYLGTDIIVGFPGESDEIFNELKSFFSQDICFDFVNCLLYNDMKGAAAFNFPDKVCASTKLERHNELNTILSNRSDSNFYFKDNIIPAERLRIIRELYKCNEKMYFFINNSYAELT